MIILLQTHPSFIELKNIYEATLRYESVGKSLVNGKILRTSIREPWRSQILTDGEMRKL